MHLVKNKLLFFIIILTISHQFDDYLVDDDKNIFMVEKLQEYCYEMKFIDLVKFIVNFDEKSEIFDFGRKKLALIISYCSWKEIRPDWIQPCELIEKNSIPSMLFVDSCISKLKPNEAITSFWENFVYVDRAIRHYKQQIDDGEESKLISINMETARNLSNRQKYLYEMEMILYDLVLISKQQNLEIKRDLDYFIGEIFTIEVLINRTSLFFQKIQNSLDSFGQSIYLLIVSIVYLSFYLIFKLILWPIDIVTYPGHVIGIILIIDQFIVDIWKSEYIFQFRLIAILSVIPISLIVSFLNNIKKKKERKILLKSEEKLLKTIKKTINKLKSTKKKSLKSPKSKRKS